MKNLQLLLTALALLLAASLVSALQAQDLVRITEFMAVNNGPLADEDGDYSDWIELHNFGANTVNLENWCLTDAAGNLTKWRFPATNLPPNGYLVVFASNKNRRTPGAPLHTNFRLDGDGEFLALVRPDGTTLMSAFTPRYPQQVARVSYGIPVVQTNFLLLTTGAVARVLVPTNDALGYTWTAPDFNDSAWLPAVMGVGYETEGQGVFTPQRIADSVADFSGRQGSNNWFYGYWDRTADLDGIYADAEFTPFPNADGPYGETNFWDSASRTWNWFNGDPPWTQLWDAGGHPNGNNGEPNRPDHWTIRRYVNEFDGPVRITGRLEHRSGWVYVTATGQAQNSLLYMYLTAPGDGYIDDIKLVAGEVAEAGPNLLPNGDFETGTLTPWTVSANHSPSAISTTVRHSGDNSLRMVATSAGSSQGTAIYQTLSPALTVGQTYTLSYWFLPGSNMAPLVVRFSGSWINTTPSSSYCGDGVVGRILVDGAEVWQGAVWVSTVDYSVLAPARQGSRMDFVLDPGLNDYCDGSTFTAALDTSDPATAIVADSVADWSLTGTQGENNWYYGYYNRTADPDRIYQATNFIAFPRGNGPHGPANYWTGTIWDWPSGNPPWDEIGRTAMHPNGVNNSQEHWVIRRWVSEVSGRVTVDWTLAKSNPAGNGVTGRVLHNGTQVDAATIAGTDSVGVARTVTLTNAQVGDFIDISLDPNGTGGSTDDGSDGSVMTVVIRGAPNLTPAITTDLATVMKDVNASAYIRVPFVVSDPADVHFLTLRMKYDDGFIAYLNGVAVASRHAPIAPEVPTWNTAATASRPDNEALQFQDFDLTLNLGLLQPGPNVLAIHGLNISAGDADFFILPELQAAVVTYDLSNRLYFASPTPGGPNGPGTTNLGPLVTDVAHSPNEPRDEDDLYVTAQVYPTFNPVGAVSLTYRVMFGAEVAVPMFDDGQHGDGLAGDGVWGGAIPAGASSPGQMVRYFVYATDTRTNGTRYPAFLDPVDSPQYQGTVVFDPGLTNPLPVLHWFIQTPANADNDNGTQCSIYFNGQFRDNAHADLHGQSARGFPKKSYDIKLAKGDDIRWHPDEVPIDSINLLSTWADKAHMRNMLAYESYRDADCPHHYAFAVRVQTNGGFFSVANWVENGDNRYLERLGLDPSGALYKMYNTFQALSDANIGINTGAEKKTRKNEGNADLVALFNGLSLSGQPLINYIFDNVDVPEVVNFLAGHVLQNDEDCCHKNYYFYRDTLGNGEWQMLPWDVDLSFGHTWKDESSTRFCSNSAPATPQCYYYDPRIYATNCYSQTTLGIGANNKLPQQLLSLPWIYQMYLRRVRTITDQQLQPPDTHPYRLHYENKVNQLAAQLAPDAALDFAKWVVPNPTVFGPTQSLATAVQDLNVYYFPPRRRWIYTTLSHTNGGPYLAPQPADAVVLIGDLEVNPTSGNQAQEYIQLVNTNNYPVDLSGWRLAGAVGYTFRGGVVLPTNGVLYVSPDVNAFRARTTGPRGNRGLFVQGNYRGQLSARGETVRLLDQGGRVVQTTNYPPAPSLAQQYLRVTEIMYHPPPPPPGLATNAEEFEYIELKNVGPMPLDLLGVRFTNGIQYRFTAASAVTNLAPGESVLLVHNLAAFASRYGGGPRVAGAYAGYLDNGGENLRLEDAAGEKVLDFAYDNDWYPITDGLGFSLVIVDETAPWDTWGLKASWRPSGLVRGSPGTNDPAPPALAPILVNEVLTRTDPPQVDAVELYNPTASDVNLGGWFISDDFVNARKFRIPNGTVISAGSYRVFTEADFNPGGTGFAFSSAGDDVYLFSGDATTNLTGYLHGFEFGAADTGVSFGRHGTSVGQEHFVAQSALTLGTNNAGPRVGPLVFTEIMFRPPDLPGGVNNEDDEFLEVRNITATNVPLFDLVFRTNTWRVRGGVDFNFPTNQTLGAGGHLLLVSFAPTNTPQLAAFRARYGVSTNVPIYGPYSGRLDNSGESVRLSKPQTPQADGNVPYVLVDAVDYADSAPWPEGADGTGASLQRLNLTQYGNDPVNWTAGAPTAGADSGGGAAPVITAQPADQEVVALSAATFTVGATGAEPLRFQWRRDGVNLDGATNATLVIPRVSPSGGGAYSVTVFNPAGTVFSSNATLTVLLPAFITAQPQDRTVFPRTNVSFAVTALSPSPLRYQWRFNGLDLPEATNRVLTLTNVQPAQDGLYAVVVTDDVGPVESEPARLTVLAHPVFTRHPTNATAKLAGAPVNVTFSAAAVSSSPVRYQWQFYGTNIAWTNMSSATSSNLVITNVQPWQAGPYTVVATDDYGSIVSSNALLTVLFAPVFTQQMQSQVLPVGADLVLTVAVSNVTTLPVYYRLRRAGTGVTNVTLDSTTCTFVLPNVATNQSGLWTVVVTNLATTGVISSNTHVTVVVPPADVFADPGSNATLNVTAYSVTRHLYQWLYGGGALTGETNASLTLTNVQPPQEGSYSVNVFSTTNVGTNFIVFASNTFPARLWVTGDHDGDGMPDRWELAYGLNWTNAADAALDLDGDGHTNLQEYQAGTDPLLRSSVLSFTSLWFAEPGAGARLAFQAVSNRTYSLLWKESLSAGKWTKLADVTAGPVSGVVEIGDPLPPAFGRVYRVVTPQQPGPVNPMPAILSSPKSTIAPVGTEAHFEMLAVGHGPLTYEWRHNDVVIPGAHEASLVIPNVQFADVGFYSVAVSDANSTEVSDPVYLAVPPRILVQPESRAAEPGDTVVFSVGAEGLGELSYLWRRDRLVLRSETNATLVLSDVQPADAGGYAVTVAHRLPVWGKCGLASSNAVLTLTDAP